MTGSQSASLLDFSLASWTKTGQFTWQLTHLFVSLFKTEFRVGWNESRPWNHGQYSSSSGLVASCLSLLVLLSLASYSLSDPPSSGLSRRNVRSLSVMICKKSQMYRAGNLATAMTEHSLQCSILCILLLCDCGQRRLSSLLELI